MNPKLPRLVTVGREGRVTLPAAMRDLLGLKEGSQVLVELEPETGLRLRPVDILPRDPAWLSRPDVREARERAEEEMKSSGLRPMTEERLKDLMKGSTSISTP